MLRRFLLEGRAFILNFACTSIGAHNEHFLHHRRRGRNTRDRRFPRTACLNIGSNTRSTSFLRPFNDRLIAFVASAVYLVKQGTCATTPVTFALDVGAHRGALHFN
jgi:hypothetical protein